MSSNPHYEGDPKAIELGQDQNGKAVIIVKSRGLNIVWGKDDRYWDIPKEQVPWQDGDPAELRQVCWLEVTGSVHTDPRKSYEVGFRLSLTPDAFGWGSSPIFVMVKRGKDGKFAYTKDTLTNPNGTDLFYITKKLLKSDCQGSTDSKLYFGMYEDWSGKWKGGLKIHHVRIKEISE